MNASAQAAHDRTEQLVLAERVAMLFRDTPRTLATAVIFSGIVYGTLLGTRSPELLLAWLVANNAVTGLRYAHILAYRRAKPPPEAAMRWLWPFVGLTAVAGVIWGLMGTLLFPAGPAEYQAIVAMFIVGTAAVGLFTLSSVWVAFCAMAIPLIVPGGVAMALQGEGLVAALGVALLFFLPISLLNSRAAVRDRTEMLRLRFENARIAEEREAALVAAEAAGRAKLQFLATMSHEIRTPLNGILGMAQLLGASSLDAEQRHRVDTVQSSGEHLLGLINDVLDFAKVEAGKLDIDGQPFELRRSVREVTDLLAPRAAERGLRLAQWVDPALPPWLVGDRMRLKQVLANLVGNAIKFTERGSVEVRVDMEAPAHGGAPARLRFTVQDTGVGISREDQGRLFEPFRQIDASASRRHGGTGLGLAISRQLVELMGGTIGLESRTGEGSTFWFTLALPVAEAPPEAAAVRARLAPLSGRVLLVEDNVVNREIAQALLQAHGLVVTCAVDGQQALDRAADERFDLVLMDCQLPVMDGYEATRRLRDRERRKGGGRTPIVALTANAIRGDRERCLEAGMDDYLAKPFRQEDLRGVLERWLGER